MFVVKVDHSPQKIYGPFQKLSTAECSLVRLGYRMMGVDNRWEMRCGSQDKLPTKAEIIELTPGYFL